MNNFNDGEHFFISADMSGVEMNYCQSNYSPASVGVLLFIIVILYFMNIMLRKGGKN